MLRSEVARQQAFFTCVPDVLSLGHPWVWVLQYTSSDYQAMLDDVDEQGVDDDLEDTM